MEWSDTGSRDGQAENRSGIVASGSQNWVSRTPLRAANGHLPVRDWAHDLPFAALFGSIHLNHELRQLARELAHNLHVVHSAVL